jgi:NAD(P)-dependent dehydrogenase (short-subunit alcohol dehydrogenase family)
MKAQEEILASSPLAAVSYLTADLSSQQQIHNLSRQVQETLNEYEQKRVDVLVNNAAMVTNWYTATENGYETQFAVNHLAPFLLTNLLLPLLQQAPEARILTTSSMSHRNTRIHWKDVMLRHSYNTLKAYKQSKLANVLFTVEFNRRYAEKTSMRAFAVDPGLVNTNIGMKGTSGIVHWFWNKRRRKGVPPEKAARTIVYLALESDVREIPGVYWKDCRPVSPSRSALNETDAARLWQLSERLCGINEEQQHGS